MNKIYPCADSDPNGLVPSKMVVGRTRESRSAAPLIPALSLEPKIVTSNLCISRVRTGSSDLADEEKDKLLFELFDVLLADLPGEETK